MKIKQIIIGAIVFGMTQGFIAASSSSVTAPTLLYSIHLPANPFQQSLYQMMVKADNENAVYNFNASSSATAASGSTKVPLSLLTILTYCMGDQGTVLTSGASAATNLTGGTFANSDYALWYQDQYHPSMTFKTNDSGNSKTIPTQPYLIYGMSPYLVRGYFEGAATTLYLQRPAQVKLPYQPILTTGRTPTSAPTVATFPDYTDLFQAWTTANLTAAVPALNGESNYTTGYGTFASANAADALSSSKNSWEGVHQPAWYTYVPQLNFAWSPPQVAYGSGFAMFGSLSQSQWRDANNFNFPPALQLHVAGAVGGTGWTSWWMNAYFLGAWVFLGSQFFPSRNFVFQSQQGTNPNLQTDGNGHPTGPISNFSAPFIWPILGQYIRENYEVQGFWFPNSARGDDGFSWYSPGTPGAPSSIAAYTFSFAPVIAPGFAQSSWVGDNSVNIQFSLPQGDFSGVFSTANASKQTVTTYTLGSSASTDACPAPFFTGQQASMNYFQMFAQNVMHFPMNKELGTNMPSGTFTELRNISPGQGLFSDALQIAGMQVDSPFIGSYGASNGAAGSTPTVTAVQDPRVTNGGLTKVTGASFTAGLPMCSKLGGGELCIEYYHGTMPGVPLSQVKNVYLPIYMNDPGLALDAPGFTYASTLSDMNTYKGVAYNTAQTRMTDFTNALAGTRFVPSSP